MYALIFHEYPTNIPLATREWNFMILLSSLFMQHLLPKTLKYLTFSCLPFHRPYGFWPLLFLRNPLFKIWIVVCTSCTQKISLSLESFNMVLAISSIVLFFLSTTPFCWGILAIDNFLFIPCSPKKSQNLFELTHLHCLISRFWFSF